MFSIVKRMAVDVLQTENEIEVSPLKYLIAVAGCTITTTPDTSQSKLSMCIESKIANIVTNNQAVDCSSVLAIAELVPIKEPWLIGIS